MTVFGGGGAGASMLFIKSATSSLCWWGSKALIGFDNGQNIVYVLETGCELSNQSPCGWLQAQQLAETGDLVQSELIVNFSISSHSSPAEFATGGVVAYGGAQHSLIYINGTVDGANVTKVRPSMALSKPQLRTKSSSGLWNQCALHLLSHHPTLRIE